MFTQRGKDLEALTVYRQVYKWNHTEAGAEYEVGSYNMDLYY